MAKMLDDADIQYFMRELEHTPVGKRYLNAWQTTRIAPKKIGILVRRRRLGQISPALAEMLMGHWRRLYIAYCNRTTTALEELTEIHSWPPESVVGKSFTEARAAALLKQGFRLTKVTLAPKSAE